MTQTATAPAPATAVPANAAVWFEIPVSDLARGRAYYAAVTGQPVPEQQMGPDTTGVLAHADGTGVGGHVYEGKPAPEGTGPTVHLAVAGPLEDTIARVIAAGGQVLSEPLTIPAGRFSYTLDPDGNSVGIFEA